jgi:hypothetical protein
LNSPLLEGDTIEVVGGKLCHVHRMDKVVLDGSEDWTRESWGDILRFKLKEGVPKCLGGIWSKNYNNLYKHSHGDQSDIEYFRLDNGVNTHVLYVYKTNLSLTLDEFKKSLQNNPITVVYEITEPYYEDITPLQSSIILKTFLESSMTIDTILPIETKLSYRTNVPSISTLSTRATELAESDNVIHNLMNIIDDEVDE